VRRPGWFRPAGRTGRDDLIPAAIDIDTRDPFTAYLLGVQAPVALRDVEITSPMMDSLRDQGVAVAVPLISQGELVGVLGLGSRKSDRPYSPDDLRLLNRLATRAAPALRLGELVRRQADEVRERERMAQELRVARLIQQNFLPSQLPSLPGWELGAHYRPAREVGGDFYDFIPLPDGRIAVVIGDVTDKGVPAALVMATTRSMVRETAQQLVEPAPVLTRVNAHLHADIPPNMFVTCQYAVIDPVAGDVVLANAGHSLPFLHHGGGVSELRATGLPLGLMPDATYDEVTAVIQPGQGLLMHSDGLAEAHDPDGEMFGVPRLMGLVGKHPGSTELIDVLLNELAVFTGPAWEVEDDVTLVSLCRAEAGTPQRCVLDEFTMPSREGSEVAVASRVVEAVGSRLSEPKRRRLHTAVAEAAMNAMEHGNHYREELDIGVEVRDTGSGIAVSISDEGGNASLPKVVEPDLVAKLAGAESPRGWGLFLIREMVDEMTTRADGDRHVVELVLHEEKEQ